MNILAFDPGHQTGVAFLVDKEWIFGMTLSSDALTSDIFDGLVDMTHPDKVVVEESPRYLQDNVVAENYARIVAWFDYMGYEITRVNPGQWKGMTASQNFKIGGQHQNDAALMAYWVWRHEAAKLINIWGAGDEQP